MTGERCTDDDLRAVVASNPDPRARTAAAELLAIRAERRADSRRAQQLKRVRWVAENLLTKVEGLGERWGAEGMATGVEPEPDDPPEDP